jgi:ATP-binding cassette subfamily B protein
VNPLRQAYRFFAPDRGRLLAVAALLLTGTLLAVLKPWPVAIAVDCVLGDRPAPAWLALSGITTTGEGLLLFMAMAAFAVHAAVAATLALGNRLAIGLGLNGLRRVRTAVFEKLQSLPLDYHLGHTQGDLIQRAAWDTCSFQTLFQQGIVTATTASLTLALMILVMARLNGPLTIVSLVTLPVLFVAIRVFGPGMMRRGAAAQEQEGRLVSRIQQNIAATRVIRAFTREAVESADFTSAAEESRLRRIRQHGLEVAYLAMVGIIFGGGVAVILLTGATQVLLGRATVGELIVFLAYLAQFYEPLNQLSNIGATVSGAAAGVRRVSEILDIPEESDPTQDPPPPPGDIRFDHVSFAFHPGQNVLQDLCLTLHAGETVALVGPSGAGKSTLLNLLQRFHEPTAGQILAGDLPLNAWSRRGWRRLVTAVQQEPLLLSGSLADNIAVGRPEASTEEIRDAARATYADGFIHALPRGYDTQVGEGEARLSVGENQRVNLARAFLKPAPLLLLDEPTSALDGETEARVADSLRRLANGRTTVLVSHRPEILQHADRVIVLAKGRILADGPPEKVAHENEFFRLLRDGRMPRP